MCVCADCCEQWWWCVCVCVRGVGVYDVLVEVCKGGGSMLGSVFWFSCVQESSSPLISHLSLWLVPGRGVSGAKPLLLLLPPAVLLLLLLLLAAGLPTA